LKCENIYLLSLLLFFKRSKVNTEMIHYCHSNGINFLSVRRCGSYFDGSALSIPHLLLQLVSHHQFRAENAVLRRCAVRKVVRKCPPLHCDWYRIPNFDLLKSNRFLTNCENFWKVQIVFYLSSCLSAMYRSKSIKK